MPTQTRTVYPHLQPLPGDSPNIAINRFICPRCGAIGAQRQVALVQHTLLTIHALTSHFMATRMECRHCGNQYAMVEYAQKEIDQGDTQCHAKPRLRPAPETT